MKAPSIAVESIHSEVLGRPQELSRILVSYQLSFDKPVIDGGVLSVRFRLVKDIGLARTTVTGVVILDVDLHEAKEAEEVLSESSKPALAEYVILRLQPLILLIEDYMGLPPIPITPPAPPDGESDRHKVPGLYQ